MFLKSWAQMGGLDLNHHWHGINVLSLLECCLLAAVLCSIVPLAFRAVRRSKRLTAMALAGTMLFATAAYAANTALSNLSASGALAGANLIYVVQTAGTGGVKATMTQVATFINSLFSGDFTCTSGGTCTVTKINGVTPPSPVGSVTSVATSCGTTGGPITGTGTISATMTTRANTATTDTILSADCGNRVTESNASAVAVTLPVATTTGFTSGYFFDIVNLGAGTVTITPTTSTINGSSTLTLAQGQGASISSDGTNYSANLGKGGSGGSPGGSSGNLQTNNGSGGFGAYSGVSGVAHQWISALNASGGATQSQPAFTDISGSLAYTQLPAGQINHPGYQASIWYPLLSTAHVNGSSAMGATTAYCSIAQLGGNTTVHPNNLGVEIVTLGTSNISLALYANDFTSGIARPGALIANTGSQVNTATGFFSVALSNIVTAAVPPGFYWQCIQSGDVTARILVHQAGTLPNLAYTGSATLSTAFGSSSLDNVSTTTGISSFGTWPSTMVGATFTEGSGNAPYLAIEFSSVP